MELKLNHNIIYVDTDSIKENNSNGKQEKTICKTV